MLRYQENMQPQKLNYYILRTGKTSLQKQYGHKTGKRGSVKWEAGLEVGVARRHSVCDPFFDVLTK